jgi:DNA-binding transcriptional LysR family regulator
MRPPTLRQIEVFKAVIETGTVSRAAKALNMSQPAASKLLANLEADTGLDLFDRGRGRLRPTERGIRLYEEVDRIFAGLQQIEQAVEHLRREERGRLRIGIMPGLSGPFICEVLTQFLRQHPNVYISLIARSSQFILDWMRSGQLDVGIVTMPVEDAHLATEALLKHPLVCVMPMGHALAAKSSVTLADIASERMISFAPGSYTRTKLEEIFLAEGLTPNVVLDSTTAQNVCELVAAGVGITLQHPLLMQSVKDRVIVRRFEPEMMVDFQMCRPKHGRSSRFVEDFVVVTREVAQAISRDVLSPL